jgi:hypothetical protein
MYQLWSLWCPNTAIYEGADWRYKDGTKLKGRFLPDGTEVDAEDAQTPISDEVYYIVPGKCTECKDFMMSLSALQYVQ